MSHPGCAGALLLVLVGVTGCGARSDLPGPAQRTAAAADPCAAPAVDAACAGAIASAAPGSEVWTTPLDVGTNDLLGPVAADTAGDTFYLAAESGLYVKTVFALDACGALRWRADVASLVAAYGYIPQVMLSAGHVLLVGIGSIVALDAQTGTHAWTADVTGFAQGGGLGVPPGKVMAMGFTAARSDGTAFTLVANDLDAWIVAVDAQGTLRAVAKVGGYLAGIGYPLGAQQLVIDAAGHVVLAGGYNPGEPDRINAFTGAGKSVYDTVLPGWGNGQFLAAGSDFVTGEGLWILGGDGTLRNTFVGGGPTFISWDGPTLVDRDDRLFAVGGEHLTPGTSTVTYDLLGGFAPDGTQSWSVTLDEPFEGGPVLGDNGELFLVTSAGLDPGAEQHLAAYALAGGARTWQVALPRSGKLPSYWLLLDAAGTLTLVVDHQVHAFASGGARPPACAWWPTPHGAPDQRVCALGK